MYSLSDFDYTLPSDRIAQTPISPRDHSKLLIVNRNSGNLQDHVFSDLTSLLGKNDVLVLNNTKVFPARIFGKSKSGKDIEILLEKEISQTPDSMTWECLTKPGLKEGEDVVVGNTLKATCVSSSGYTRHIQLNLPREEFFPLLFEIAHTPIPPYIEWDDRDERELRERYQTVYASKIGAIAAPTAGLHFTPSLLKILEQKGVEIAELTLHVGLGTFLPVKTQRIQDHAMHAERFELSKQTAQRLNIAKRNGKRIIAVGTTSVRVLESCTDTNGILHAQTGETSIYLYPPYQFKFVNSLITNFHTPKSTLLMLVSAMVSHPNTNEHFSTFQQCLVGTAYQHALDHHYRFYSFGDAMWIQ